MAQKAPRDSVACEWKRNIKRLVPQQKKLVLLVMLALLTLGGLCGVLAAQNPGVVIAQAQDTQKDSSNSQANSLDNTQDEVEVDEIAKNTAAQDSEEVSSDTKHQEIQNYYVHVDGGVLNPGVYELSASQARVSDAVEAAGGLSSEADTSAINLAEPLVDGAKVHIPVAGEKLQPQGSAQAIEPSSTTSTSGTQGLSLSAAGSAEGSRVNLNTATAEELQTLPGVGEATAQAIIEDREAHGPFASPEDLMRVSGIGEKKFAKLQDKVCI